MSLDKFQKLCRGVQAVGSSFEIHFKSSESDPSAWSITVVAGGAAILIRTDFGTLDEVLDEACRKLASMSQKTLAAVRPSRPPPDTDKE